MVKKRSFGMKKPDVFISGSTTYTAEFEDRPVSNLCEIRNLPFVSESLGRRSHVTVFIPNSSLKGARKK